MSAFGDKALGGCVWVEFRPSMAGVGLRVWHVEVRLWVRVWGQGLGSARPEGISKGKGSDPASQQVPQVPRWQGKCWPHSLLILCPQDGLSCFPSGRGNPSPPPVALQEHWFHPASTSPPPLLPTTSYPVAGGFLPFC